MWLFSWRRSAPRSKPTYDGYPDHRRPVQRPPRKTWIERLEEKLTAFAKERRKRGIKPYDPYEEKR